MKKPIHRFACSFILNILFLGVAVFGQSNALSNPSVNSQSPFDKRNTSKLNNDKNLEFPKRGAEKLDWGLALSGGGIRSGSFSVGVLKALYDKEIGGERLLDQIDVISSVSGGGYSSLWLISNYLSDPETVFGERTFEDASFVRNVCKLQSGSKFVTKRNVFDALFRNNPYSFDMYEGRILSTFGNSWELNTEHNKMNALKPYISGAKMPYFIFNVALKRGELGRLGQIVEITPDYIGNPVLGYYNWDQGENKDVLRVSEAAAISGAGVKFKLQRKLDNFSKEVIRRKKLTLFDGGYAENLAALPLIRRGIKNIIISDAEHDPGYKFGGYVILQDALADMGINFCVDGIEACDKNICKPLNTGKNKIRFSKVAVSTGCVKSDPKKYKGSPVESKIYYMKMSKPDSLFSAEKFSGDIFEGRSRSEILASGENLIKERQTLIKVPETETAVDCEKALGFDFNPDMYFFRVNSYNTYLSGRQLFKITGKIFPKSFQYKFPQIPTIDQNYYADQMETFVALGYLEASQLNF